MNSSSHGPAAPVQPSRIGLGVLLGLGASLAFATSGAFARPLLDAGWTPGGAVFWRVVGAAVLMLPIGLWVMRGRLREVVAEVPEEWLETTASLPDLEAVRSAYVEHLMLRLAEPAAWTGGER